MAVNPIKSADLAWEYYLQGFRLHWLSTPDANREAREMFKQAYAVRPDFARAHAHLSFTLMVAWLNGWDRTASGLDPEVTQKNFTHYADLAFNADKNDYDNRWSLGLALCYSGRPGDAITEYDKAITDAQNDKAAAINIAAIRIDKADALMFSAGDGDEQTVQDAIKEAEEALAISATPQRWFHWTLGWCYYEAGFYNKAKELEYSLKALKALSSFRRPDTLVSKLLIAVHSSLGLDDNAKRLADDFLKANKHYTIDLEERWPYPKGSKRFARYLGHLQKAGLK